MDSEPLFTDADLKPEPILKRIRDHHHLLAKLVAAGHRTGEIASMTGMSISRISILKGDPTFQELVARYREKMEAVELDAYKEILTIEAAIYRLAAEETIARLMDAPESFGNRDLLDMQSNAADRLGVAKISRSQNVNVNVDLAESLAEARKRAFQLSASPPVDVAVPGPVPSQPRVPAPSQANRSPQDNIVDHPTRRIGLGPLPHFREGE